MMLSLTDLKTLSYPPPRLQSLSVSADGSEEVSSSHLSPLSEQTSPSSSHHTSHTLAASPADQTTLDSEFDMHMDGLLWRDLDLNSNSTTTAASLGIGGPLHHVRKILISAPQPEMTKGRNTLPAFRAERSHISSEVRTITLSSGKDLFA